MLAADPSTTASWSGTRAGARPPVALGVPLAGLEARLGPAGEDRSAAPAEFQGAAAAARRWLAVGRDVLLVGDAGSGRSSVLQEFVHHAAQRGVHVLALAAPPWTGDHGPLSSLRTHEVVARTAQARELSPAVLEAVLADELRGTQNVVVVDDLERFDPASASVVERLLSRPRVRLLASTTRDRAHADAQGRTIAGRVPAEVSIAPLGFWGMSSLLRSHLGGPPDAGLISSVVSRSGGIPGVAVALADAGRFSGAVQLVDGRWIEVQPLDGVPHGLVARTLAGTASTEMLDALELLAWTGPLPVPDALRLVGTTVLARLGDSGRLTSYRAARGAMVTVAPPALSRALRHRMTDLRRQVLAERVGTLLHEPPPARTARHTGTVDDLLRRRAVGADDVRGTAGLTGLVHERAAVRDAVLAAAWRRCPTVPRAVRLLEGTTGRPRAEHLDEVFARTVPTPTDPPLVLVRFRMHQAQWDLWRTGDLAAVTDELRRQAAGLGTHGRFLHLLAMLLEISRDGVPAGLDPVAELQVDVEDDVLRIWTVVARANLLLESGRPEAALTLLEEGEAMDGAGPLGRALEVSRSDALLLLGEYEAAEVWSRDRLADACLALDPQGIRLHSLKLAECLFLTGRQREAWQELAVSLRLGPPHPLGLSCHERTLALGVALQAQAGDVALAQLLHRELEELPVTYRSVLGSLREWAAATLLYAEGDPEAADDLLWATAVRARDQGMHASAVLCATSRRSPYPVRSARALAHLLDRAPVALFDPLAALHLAMARRDHRAIVRALDGLGPGLVPDLVDAALRLLQQARRSEGLPALGPVELDRLAHGGPAEGVGPAEEIGLDGRRRLTDREREVTLLARAGSSNREIARRLGVSVRTIENHVYRALRKLDLANRADLATWAPRAAEPEGAVPEGAVPRTP